jgi:hypothetical protein
MKQREGLRVLPIHEEREMHRRMYGAYIGRVNLRVNEAQVRTLTRIQRERECSISEAVRSLVDAAAEPDAPGKPTAPGGTEPRAVDGQTERESEQPD